jgi:hypothetical protein
MINIIRNSDSEICDLYLKIDTLVNEIYDEDEDLRFRDPYGQLFEKINNTNGLDTNTLLLSWVVSRIEKESNTSFLKKVIHVINGLREYFWCYIKDNQLKINNETINKVKTIILNAKVSQELSMSERYTQNNFFKRIEKFKNERAWSKLYEITHMASEWFQYFVDMEAVGGFKFLLEYSQPEELEDVLGRLDISVLWGIFANIDTLDLLNFINKCENKFIIFTALSSIFPFNGSVHLDKNSLIDDLLVNVFVKAGSDINFFSELLNIFNRYPIRYERLQNIIGITLARLDNEDVIFRYYTSMVIDALKSNSNDRIYVRNCLHSFENNSQNKKLINRCWEIAYEIWSVWDFDIPTYNYLFEIKHSLIDFAVVKYYMSNFSLEEIEKLIEELFKEMESIDDRWYLNRMDLVTNWNKLKSKMQPLYHAKQLYLSSSLDPLQHEIQYDFENLSKYISFRFGN